MEIVWMLLKAATPAIVGILTVPAMKGLKALPLKVGALPAWLQQVVVVIIAGALTGIGTLTNVVLPETVELITQADVSAVLSAAIAMAVHAGQKAKAVPPA
jgi:hypothetical protein